MFPVAVVLAALSVLFALIALPGYLVQRSRAYAAHDAVTEYLPVVAARPPRTGTLEDRDWQDAIDDYVERVGEAHWACALRIGQALDRFCRGMDVPEERPVHSISSALRRMRTGVLEPIGAYRPGLTDTGEIDLEEMRQLLGLAPLAI